MRLRATYNPKHGIRYILGAPDVQRDRLYAKIRPSRGGRRQLGFTRTIGEAKTNLPFGEHTLIPGSVSPTCSAPIRPSDSPATVVHAAQTRCLSTDGELRVARRKEGRITAEALGHHHSIRRESMGSRVRASGVAVIDTALASGMDGDIAVNWARRSLTRGR